MKFSATCNGNHPVRMRAEPAAAQRANNQIYTKLQRKRTGGVFLHGTAIKRLYSIEG